MPQLLPGLRYVTRNGLTTDAMRLSDIYPEYPYIGHTSDGALHLWRHDGRWCGRQHPLDIVALAPGESAHGVAMAKIREALK